MINERVEKRILRILFKLAVVIVTLFMLSSLALSQSMVTTTDGWLTDFDGNLVQDDQGYYVYEIQPDDVNNGYVVVDLNKFIEIFLYDFYNESDALVRHKLKIVNDSGKTLTYFDYDFTTENILPRTDSIFTGSPGGFTNALNRAFGSAYTAMLPAITSSDYKNVLCVDVKGFDDKNINLMMLNLRCVNDAIIDFYNVDHSFDINLQQMMGFDNDLKNAGYNSYADYLKQYYNVNNFSELYLEQVYNILGTTNGAQSAITNWDNNAWYGKPIPVNELNKLTDDFRIWGFLTLNKDITDRDEYPYVPNYFILETDPEVIQLAYDYLYSNGLRFSFDFYRQSFDTTDREYAEGGDFSVKSYFLKTSQANENVQAIFDGLELEDEESFVLDEVAAGLYVPNAWNQFRLYDFGVSIVFKAEDGGGIIPKTGDDSNIMLWAVLFIGSTLGVIILKYDYKPKKNK